MAARILVVDDEAQILKVVAHRLEKDGHQIVVAMDGEQALSIFKSTHVDLIVLDLMLPKVDGFEVCRQIRQESTVPIIVLSAKSDEVDRIVGFRLGVDDYVTKPFSPSELAARVNAILRRIQSSSSKGTHRGSQVQIGNITIDRDKRLVTKGGVQVDLTAKEFDLLWLLASHPDQVFTKEQLLEQIWETNYLGDLNNVTVLISRLRDKIEDDASSPQLVKTVWGVGYKVASPH